MVCTGLAEVLWHCTADLEHDCTNRMQEGDEHISESILSMSKNVNGIYYAWYIHDDRCQFYDFGCQATTDTEGRDMFVRGKAWISASWHNKVGFVPMLQSSPWCYCIMSQLMTLIGEPCWWLISWMMLSGQTTCSSIQPGSLFVDYVTLTRLSTRASLLYWTESAYIWLWLV